MSRRDLVVMDVRIIRDQYQLTGRCINGKLCISTSKTVRVIDINDHRDVAIRGGADLLNSLSRNGEAIRVDILLRGQTTSNRNGGSITCDNIPNRLSVERKV